MSEQRMRRWSCVLCLVCGCSGSDEPSMARVDASIRVDSAPLVDPDGVWTPDDASAMDASSAAHLDVVASDAALDDALTTSCFPRHPVQVSLPAYDECLLLAECDGVTDMISCRSPKVGRERTTLCKCSHGEEEDIDDTYSRWIAFATAELPTHEAIHCGDSVYEMWTRVCGFTEPLEVDQ